MNSAAKSNPQVFLRAQKVGRLVGVLVLAVAITFRVLFRDALPEPLYWLLFVSGIVLIVALPSWLVGRYAKRRFERAQVPDEDSVPVEN
jgi:hypothetical protein